MTVSSGWNSRDVSLNGRLIGVTVSTPGSAAKPIEQDRLAVADLADDGDDRPLGADVVERGQALGEDLALDSEDLGLAGGRGHHDEHRGRGLLVGRSAKQKSRGLTSASFARHDPCPRSVTGNHHAGHRK